MLHVVIKNIRRMLKHKLITPEIFKKFKLPEIESPPEAQSQ